MGVQRGGVEPPVCHCLCGGMDALDVDLRIPLVGIDHVEPPPVPVLHVDSAGALLVISGDDEPTPNARKPTRQVERRLLARRLDHAVAAVTARPVHHLLDDRLGPVHRSRLFCAHLHRRIQRKWSARGGKNSGSGLHCELYEKRSQKPDSNDGDR